LSIKNWFKKYIFIEHQLGMNTPYESFISAVDIEDGYFQTLKWRKKIIIYEH